MAQKKVESQIANLTPLKVGNFHDFLVWRWHAGGVPHTIEKISTKATTLV
jgi:hypothetical protein